MLQIGKNALKIVSLGHEPRSSNLEIVEVGNRLAIPKVLPSRRERSPESFDDV